VGQALAGSVRAGEPLTDVRLVQAALLSAFEPGTVLATIRVYDPAAAALVEPGDRVDVVGIDPRSGGGTAVIALGATVATTPESGDPLAMGDGAPLVLAVDQSTALALAEASVHQQLSVLIV
jgi:Flp pilus assembly protein CpaB